jgi:ectoine hydroxylase-related dioxygenase (phytanoyl-CoA dioxygenase family)
MVFNSPELVAGLLDKIESSSFNKEVYDKTGIFIMRSVLPESLVKEWRSEWDEFYAASLANGRNVNVNNPVDLKEKLPEKLATLYKNDILLDIAEQVFGKNVALNNHRFVIKDKFSLGEVFLHQDYCYNLGFPNKASFFVPLSYAGKKNGMLTFYAGTHKYGYLADAGEIDPSYFKEKWPQVTPELQPGDFAIMNNCLWHESGDNVAGIDRILADIILQPADDPSGKELLRGEWQTDIFIDRQNPMKIFKRSRASKIVDLTQNQKTEQ